MLKVTGREALLTRQWAAALENVVVRHPNRDISLVLTLEDAPMPCLTFELDTNLNSENDEIISPFMITNVTLTYFPGVMLARQWLAAAWAGFVSHEALELVTVGDSKTRVMDPHETRARLNVFHISLPFQLTPETLFDALVQAVSRPEAEKLMPGYAV